MNTVGFIPSCWPNWLKLMLALFVSGCGYSKRNRSIYMEIVQVKGDIYVCRSLEELRAWKPGMSRGIVFYDFGLSEGDLQFLVRERSVEVISAEGVAASSGAIAGFAKAPGLRAIKIWQAEISQDKLAPLKSCHSLEEIIMAGEGVTDELLRDLATIESLRLVQLGKNQVTQRCLDELAKTRPELKIEYLSQ